MKNIKMQTSIALLKTNATSGSGEQGFKASKTGEPSPMIQGGAHNVNFGDKTGYAGAYHNHTKLGIPMLSPPDINQLLSFARSQGNYGDPAQAFLGMVAPNGMHYIIRFTGNYQDAVNSNFIKEDLKNYTDNMNMRYGIYKSLYSDSNGSMNNNGVQYLLFETIKEMGLEGKIELQRIDDDGIKTIKLNNDGTTTAVPCS